MGIETVFVTYQNYTPVANGKTHKSGLANMNRPQWGFHLPKFGSKTQQPGYGLRNQ